MRSLKIAGILLSVELLSFAAFFYPSLAGLVFIVVCLAVFIAALKDLRYGVLAALAELFVGGMGYLFVWPVGGLNFSIRMGLFLILLAVAIVKIIRERKIEFFKSNLFLVYCSLFFFIILGLILGYFRGHNPAYIFFDANGFFFLGYLPVFYQAFKNKEDLKMIWPVFWAAAVWLAVKTLAVFFIFTHGFAAIVPVLYKWIRETGVGEMTPLAGGFYRVFFQSQIYLVIWFILICVQKILAKDGRVLFFLPKGRLAAGGAPQVSAAKNKICPSFLTTIVIFSAILLSFSRSFWAGLALALFLSLVSAWIFLRIPGRQILKSIGWNVGASLAGFLLILAVSYFPYPQRPVFSFAELLGKRALSISDPAAASRWAQLPPLWQAVKKRWLFGSGFGATVSFQTHDPRALAADPTGERVAYAFEWGWLDIWLKVGFFGLAAFLLLLWKILRLGWQNAQYSIPKFKNSYSGYVNFGLIISVITLAAIHFFTPYLNHPLGLGWLMLVGLIVERNKY